MKNVDIIDEQEDSTLLNWLTENYMTVAPDIYAGAVVWACFRAYPDKPLSTAHPFELYETPRAAIRAAMMSSTTDVMKTPNKSP